MRTLRFVALTLVAILAFAAAAEAACATTDLNNTQWYAYIKFTGGWSRCFVRIGASGAVLVATDARCVAYEEPGPTQTTETITGGTLRVNTACVVTGNINTNQSGQHTILHAALDGSTPNGRKTMIIGVGKDASGDAWQFSAVKK